MRTTESEIPALESSSIVGGSWEVVAHLGLLLEMHLLCPPEPRCPLLKHSTLGKARHRQEKRRALVPATLAGSEWRADAARGETDLRRPSAGSQSGNFCPDCQNPEPQANREERRNFRGAKRGRSEAWPRGEKANRSSASEAERGFASSGCRLLPLRPFAGDHEAGAWGICWAILRGLHAPSLESRQVGGRCVRPH